MLISVILPFINLEVFLEETINSVINQSYTDWELLLIDDGSLDKSTEIAKSYAEQFSRIKYFAHDNHANKGLSASRNLGISLADGDIIAFLDGDDVWFTDFLSNGINIMKAHSSSLYCEATVYWKSWNSDKDKDIIIPVGTEQDQLYSCPDLIFKLYPLGLGAAPCLCGMLIDKKVLVKHGCLDENFKGMYDDQVFLIKFYLHEKVYISSICNNLYRQRKGSLVDSSHSQGNYFEHRKFFLEWMESYIQVNAPKNREVKKLLRKNLFPFRFPKLNIIVSYLNRLQNKL